MWMCLIQTIEELNRTKRLSKKELFLSHLKELGHCLVQPSEHTETTALGSPACQLLQWNLYHQSPASRSLDSEWNFTSMLVDL